MTPAFQLYDVARSTGRHVFLVTRALFALDGDIDKVREVCRLAASDSDLDKHLTIHSNLKAAAIDL